MKEVSGSPKPAEHTYLNAKEPPLIWLRSFLYTLRHASLSLNLATWRRSWTTCKLCSRRIRHRILQSRGNEVVLRDNSIALVWIKESRIIELEARASLLTSEPQFQPRPHSFFFPATPDKSWQNNNPVRRYSFANSSGWSLSDAFSGNIQPGNVYWPTAGHKIVGCLALKYFDISQFLSLLLIFAGF
jgi:hypothetical protein